MDTGLKEKLLKLADQGRVFAGKENNIAWFNNGVYQSSTNNQFIEWYSYCDHVVCEQFGVDSIERKGLSQCLTVDRLIEHLEALASDYPKGKNDNNSFPSYS